MLNKGDKIIIREYGAIERVARISTIVRVSAKSAWDKLGIKTWRHQEPATPAEIAEAEAQLKEREAMKAAAEAEKANRAADPRLSALDYLHNGFNFQMHKLTTEQLTTIRRWIEELD